ncbi:calcium-activated chloride channel regulator 3A-1-like [Anneissia japonica]|uniref:calcium-activated chloride channel regulator 3A-1-like n=1 Tax=Anneissia japonica TaxID=1529436 RepID=UPI001425BACF|nr:calcium-activated chloride channel regulator 3A-1-like [Anneissia japonica]
MSVTEIIFSIKAAVLFIFIGSVLFVDKGCAGPSRVLLVDNKYINVVVGINERVKEDHNLIEKLKERMTEASAFLYSATNQRAYFKDIHILVPETWQRRPHYSKAEWELYDNSDVIIDLPSDDFGSRPYTSKATQCGELGNYIHLTPRFVLDQSLQRHYGHFDKAFVHEWAHYRWGVFDEYAEDDMPQFYINSDGQAEAVRCVLNIPGSLRNPHTSGPCEYGSDGLPLKDCRFFDNRESNDFAGSIMYKQYLPKVTTFCDNDHSGGWKGNLHNRQAPNKHNQQCGGKSIWEVMKEHFDFANGLNPSLDITGLPENPTFKIIHQQTKRTVIVLDVSASMKGEPLIQLRQAASNLISSTAEDGEQIGIVTFSREATIKSRLVTINQQTRKSLVTKLPTDASGGTSVGAGILRAFDVLGISLNEDSKDTGNLLVISDGAENIRPLIEDLQDKIATKNIHINTVAIGPTASPNLEVLANLTNGMTFYHTTGTNTLNEAFGTSFNKNKAIQNRPIYLFSDVITVFGGDTVVREVQVDRTINRNAEFIFGFDPYSQLSIVVIQPDGTEVTDTPDSVFGVLRVKVPSPVQTGNWRFRIRNYGQQVSKITVTIQSFSSTSEEPIIATASWSRMAVTPPERQVLYVYVSKGYTPIINAEVIAEVEIAGNTTDAPVLSDDGTGADVNRNDGIYSGYFTNFVAEGRYNVKVKITNKAGVTLIAHGKTLGSAKSALPDPLYEENAESTQTRRSEEETGPFQRVANGGSFTCTGACTSDEDHYPPARVTDLRVSLLSYSKKEVELKFKAPGDDLMNGRAKEYRIYYSTNFNNLYDNIDVIAITPDLVKEGSLSSPNEAGQEEVFTIIVPQVGDFAYTFTVLAVDDVGNKSPRSNFVTISANDHSGKVKGWVICTVLFSIAAVILFGLIVFVLVYRRKIRNSQPEKPVPKNITVSEMEKANSLRTNSMTRLDPSLTSPKKKRAPNPPIGHMSCFEPGQLNLKGMKVRKHDMRASVPARHLHIERAPKYENTDFKTYENAMLDNNIPRGHVRSTAFLIEKTNTIVHKV